METLPSEYVHLDGTKVTDKIIAIGGTNIVVQKGIYALKIPRLLRYTTDDGTSVLLDQSKPPHEGGYNYCAQLIQALANEKAIYQRIGNHVGVCPCYNLASKEPSLCMKRMDQDLRHYLKVNRPKRRQQLAWITQLAETLAYIHSRRVIVADVNTSNVVIDDGSNVKFIDFSESTLMPLDWNLEGSDTYGYSIQSDIGQFGSLMFQVVTGQRCEFTLEDGDTGDDNNELAWPQRQSLPQTDTVWLGATIEKCWTKNIYSGEDLVADLKQVKIADSEGSADGMVQVEGDIDIGA